MKMGLKYKNSAQNKGVTGLYNRVTTPTNAAHAAVNGMVTGGLAGLTWQYGRAKGLPLAIAAMGTGLTIMVSDLAEGPEIDIDQNYSDSTISPQYSLKNQGLTYSALDIKTPARDDPYIIVQDNDLVRFYSSNSDSVAGNELGWVFEKDQTEALLNASAILEALEQAKREFDLGIYENLPTFIEFESISKLYQTKDIAGRVSSPSGVSITNTPTNLNERITDEIAFWASAVDSIKAGKYGFDSTKDHSTVQDKNNQTVQNQPKKEEHGATTTTLPHATDITLAPNFPNQPRNEFSDGVIKGAGITGNIIIYLTLLTGGIGVLGGGLSGAASYIQEREEKKKKALAPKF